MSDTPEQKPKLKLTQARMFLAAMTAFIDPGQMQMVKAVCEEEQDAIDDFFGDGGFSKKQEDQGEKAAHKARQPDSGRDAALVLHHGRRHGWRS